GRRRHTRCLSDWSSDVCSSDLSVYSSVGYSRPRVLPQEKDIQHAAEVLNEGEKVAILIGQGARGAAAEIEQVADLLGAGVAKALDRKSTRLNSSHLGISYAVFC